MPIKNQDPFLEECLNSIRKQTKQDWELIVVDDHSDDQSSSILSIWAKKEPRIQTFENPGSGIVDALNFGISKSNSDLIARMDGDDLMDPNRLEEQSKFLQHNKALGVVSCEVIQFTHSKEHKERAMLTMSSGPIRFILLMNIKHTGLWTAFSHTHLFYLERSSLQNMEVTGRGIIRKILSFG